MRATSHLINAVVICLPQTSHQIVTCGLRPCGVCSKPGEILRVALLTADSPFPSAGAKLARPNTLCRRAIDVNGDPTAESVRHTGQAGWVRYPLNHPLGRFGIETDDRDPDLATASVPTAGLVNPLTGLPTIAPLAMLVDHVAGAANHVRRGTDEWTVSSELALEVAPGALEAIAAAPDRPVLGVARAMGPKGSTALALCELSVDGIAIAMATVRSFYIPAPTELVTWPDDDADAPVVGPKLADRMAVEVGETGGAVAVLVQRDDRAVYNGVGAVHGGVSSMGLELVGSAALNSGPDAEFVTGSLRVNFFRPMHGGAGAHYSATPVRMGRRTATADVVAVGSDGRPALVGRLTAYR